MKGLSSFQVCGVAGLLLAVLQSAGLVLHRGLSLTVLAVLFVLAVLAFLGLAMATKILTGREQLIYYRQKIALVLSAGLALRWLHQPLLPYLDVVILAIGAFLVCGRIGCLMVGCCHGRPSRWGVRYRGEHADAGFTPHYVGIRLFPIQLVESLWVLGVVAVGLGMVLREDPAGSALAWYVMAYGVGRFVFEHLRGDPARAYWKGFSEGHWTSMILLLLVAGAELAGALPLQGWHLAATAGMVLTMAGTGLFRRLRGCERHLLLQPRHVQEVADLLLRAETGGDSVPVRIGSTSLGVRISAGVSQDGAVAVHHYALSSRQGCLESETASSLAGLIRQLKHPASPFELVNRNGVFHLLVHSPG